MSSSRPRFAVHTNGHTPASGRDQTIRDNIMCDSKAAHGSARCRNSPGWDSGRSSSSADLVKVGTVDRTRQSAPGLRRALGRAAYRGTRRQTRRQASLRRPREVYHQIDQFHVIRDTFVRSTGGPTEREDIDHSRKCISERNFIVYMYIFWKMYFRFEIVCIYVWIWN